MNTDGTSDERDTKRLYQNGVNSRIGALNPQQQNIPHVIEIAEKFGLESLPPD